MLVALILGIVEGLTEFLPISSTAHLIITNRLLGLSQNEYWKFFEIFVQVGAIMAVITVYFQELFKHKQNIKLLFSFLPTAIVGLLFYNVIKNVFFNSLILIALSLIGFGLVFLLIEYLINKKQLILTKNLNNLTIRQAMIIGLAQSLAVIPGVSRSGAALVGSLLLGYSRQEAAKYSFLLAVPTIILAALFDLLKTDFNVVSSNVGITLVGLVSAYLSALFVIKWFLHFLKNNSLVVFGIYRIIVGILLLIFLI